MLHPGWDARDIGLDLLDEDEVVGQRIEPPISRLACIRPLQSITKTR